MPSSKNPPPDAPARTRDYGSPTDKKVTPEQGPVLIEKARTSTRRGVGYDERRPPPAALPKRVKRLDQPLAVALVTSDALQRSTLARGLVRAGCDVSSIASIDAIADIKEALDVTVVDFDAPEGPTLVAALREVMPELPILALTTRKAEVARGLQILKLVPFEVLDRAAPIADVLLTVKRLAGS